MGCESCCLLFDDLRFEVVQCRHGRGRVGHGAERNFDVSPAVVMPIAMLAGELVDAHGLVGHGSLEQSKVNAFGELIVGEGAYALPIDAKGIDAVLQDGDGERLLVERVSQNRNCCR